MTQTTASVELRGVHKTYQLDSVEVPALIDINLVIRPNCFTVISSFCSFCFKRRYMEVVLFAEVSNCC